MLLGELAPQIRCMSTKSAMILQYQSLSIRGLDSVHSTEAGELFLRCFHQVDWTDWLCLQVKMLDAF